jgi:hypothetical protein
MPGSQGAQVRDELLERELELAVLDGLVQRVDRGSAALALIEGPAGIGKSRLLRAARERARAAGFRTLAARGSDLERGLPFGVVDAHPVTAVGGHASSVAQRLGQVEAIRSGRRAAPARR